MSLDTWTGTLPTAADTAQTDAWLWRVMQSAKNKAMIASLEDSLHVFVLDDSQTRLPFPPRSPFHRKVCYLVARRYGLAHRLEPFGNALSDDHTQPVRLVLLKTPYSTIPTQRLAQLVDGPPPFVEEVKTGAGGGGAKVEEEGERVVVSSTKFLRRPRSADGKTSLLSRPVGASAASGTPLSILRSISEEDYRKARARIFKCAESDTDSKDPVDEPQSVNDYSVKIVRSAHIAKGPVEGSTGFERRRNCRNIPSQPTQLAMSDKPPRTNVGDRPETSRPVLSADNGRNFTRLSQLHFRGNQDTRMETEQASRLTNSASTFANGAGNGNGYSYNAGRRQVAYNLQERNQSDRQDPDFDRRYDKWAVRTALPHPPQQHTPLPIFGQLLYPYSVHGGAQHLHPSTLHLRSMGAPGGQVQQANIGQYQSPQLHHAPANAMMFQHLGQGIGGFAEYAGRSVSMSEQGSHYDAASAVEQFGHNLSREMSSLQHQTLPSQVTRTPSAAYGLDSTVDFPPLP